MHQVELCKSPFDVVEIVYRSWFWTLPSSNYNCSISDLYAIFGRQKETVITVHLCSKMIPVAFFLLLGICLFVLLYLPTSLSPNTVLDISQKCFGSWHQIDSSSARGGAGRTCAYRIVCDNLDWLNPFFLMTRTKLASVGFVAALLLNSTTILDPIFTWLYT